MQLLGDVWRGRFRLSRNFHERRGVELRCSRYQSIERVLGELQLSLAKLVLGVLAVASFLMKSMKISKERLWKLPGRWHLTLHVLRVKEAYVWHREQVLELVEGFAKRHLSTDDARHLTTSLAG